MKNDCDDRIVLIGLIADVLIWAYVICLLCKYS